MTNHIMTNHITNQNHNDEPVYWHYVNVQDQQCEPITAEDLKSEWQSGQIDGNSLVWNDALPDWQTINDLGDLYNYLTS